MSDISTLTEAYKDVRVRMDTRVRSHIRILNGAMDEDPASPQGIVVQGRIDAATLRFLQVADYQRPLENRPDIWDALKGGTTLPAVEIGVRGQEFECDGSDYIIYSPAFIIDGWQRCGNAMRLLDTVPDMSVRLLATVHFGTTFEWEEDRFTAVNKNVRKVSANQHLRNLRDKNDAVLAIWKLCDTPGFPLHKRVCWSQGMQRTELLSALVMCKCAMYLHSHKVAIAEGRIETVAHAIANARNTVGDARFKQNVATFFSVINECWPFSIVQYRAAATQAKSSFLYELARMFTRHPAFWDGPNENALFVSADDRRKLSKFPINDKQVVQLAGSPGAARKILYQLLVDHMNSGRRTQRLVAR